MKSNLIIYFLITISIGGCVMINPEENQEAQIIMNQSCALTELEKFMAFGARFSALSNQEKRDECNQLRFKYHMKKDLSTGWSLAYAISDFPGCGTFEEGLDMFQKTQTRLAQTNQLQWLINHHINLLTRLKKISKKNKSLTQALELTQNKLSSTEDDRNNMALKLLELKTIETSINQRLEEEQNEAK